MTEQYRRHYVAQVIDLYCCLPDTSSRARSADRRLAAELCDRGIDLALVQDALWLASARRRFRDPDAAPLPKVRSLAYFSPVVDELLQKPLPPGYREYLRYKLSALDSRRPSPPLRTRGPQDP